MYIVIITRKRQCTPSNRIVGVGLGATVVFAVQGSGVGRGSRLWGRGTTRSHGVNAQSSPLDPKP